MSFDHISEFQKGQRETVSKLGAFLSQLNTLIEVLDEGDEASLNEKIKRLQPTVGEFMTNSPPIHSFLSSHHYPAYYRAIGPVANSIATLLANQTMPSKRIEREKFKKQYQEKTNELSNELSIIVRFQKPLIALNMK